MAYMIWNPERDSDMLVQYMMKMSCNSWSNNKNKKIPKHKKHIHIRRDQQNPHLESPWLHFSALFFLFWHTLPVPIMPSWWFSSQPLCFWCVCKGATRSLWEQRRMRTASPLFSAATLFLDTPFPCGASALPLLCKQQGCAKIYKQ